MTTPSLLQSQLANALPASATLLFHHIVSDSLACPEIFAAPPNESPEPTTSESHLFSASIHHEGKPLQVFALEIYIYTTDSLTTIFVSKADSTGYLHLLALPKDTPSLIKTSITTFLNWLIEQKRRHDTNLVLSLFARAQDQYLFPGSVDNQGKHVLDDRGLIRWWCRVLDPILADDPSHNARAHLIIPGLDNYETRAYFPKSNDIADGRWAADDPLQEIGKRSDLPIRCYIPHFPDDPKARFLTDLDDELPKSLETDTSGKGRFPGIWKSVKSMDEFWELMSFRQECSAGRLVGFIWAVFEPIKSVGGSLQSPVGIEEQREREEPTLPTPADSQQQYLNMVRNIETTEAASLGSLGDSSLSSLPSSQPQPQQSIEQVNERCPPSSTHIGTGGKVIDSGIKLNDEAYKKTLLLLDSLDYADLELALDSTTKFIESVSKEIGTNDEWGFEVRGKGTISAIASVAPISGDATADTEQSRDAPVNLLKTGMVRSKKRLMNDVTALPIDAKQQQQQQQQQPEVRVLSASTVRKKAKV